VYIPKRNKSVLFENVWKGRRESTAPTPLSRCGVLKGYELNRWRSILL